MRVIRTAAAACAIIGALIGAVTGCSAGTSSTAAGDAANQGSVSATCYVRVSDSSGNSVTVAFLGETDCTQPAGTIADTMGPSGFSVDPNVPKGPGSVVCIGSWDGDTVSVISTLSGSNAVCNDLALGPVG